MSTLKRNVFRIALVTVVILSIPLIAMQFDSGVDWSIFDFVVAGALLFGTGAAFELVSRKGNNSIYRAAVGVAAVTVLLMTWANLAVGIIGSGANPANLMFVLVYVVGLIGAAASRLEARRMARTMFATAAAQMLVPTTAIAFWPELTQEPPGVVGVIVINGFIAALFVLSGILFRHSSANKEQAQTA